MALHIDWTQCDGRGLCSELLPALIERDVWGYPLARDRTRQPVVPVGMEREAQAAASMCPRLALSLVEVDGP
ncbi:ferredoxin [Rhodococcus sp. ACT016]|uniref:ferredoxin n=1 Tax=Rhodococcus sp. ACT016 TaxID=3134808 RepID=UPI003D29A1A7